MGMAWYVWELALILWNVALKDSFTPCINRVLQLQPVYSPWSDKQLKQVEKTLSNVETYGETSRLNFFFKFSLKTHRRQMFTQLVAEREHLKWPFISRNFVVEFTL
jgi:hypothetical protein